MKDIIFAALVAGGAYILVNSGAAINQEYVFLGVVGSILAVWWVSDATRISRNLRKAKRPEDRAHIAGFGCGWLLAVAVTLLFLFSIGKVNGWL